MPRKKKEEVKIEEIPSPKEPENKPVKKEEKPVLKDEPKPVEAPKPKVPPHW